MGCCYCSFCFHLYLQNLLLPTQNLCSPSNSPGQEISRVLPAEINSYVIEGLRPGVVYIIGVSALVGSREGSPVTTTATTGEISSGCWAVFMTLPTWQHHCWQCLSALCPVASAQVGMVTSLRVLESRSNVVRVSWVGVPSATAYRVVWSLRDGKIVALV